MNIGSVVGISGSGLDSIGRQLAIVSQNVANASTPGYSRERLQISALAAGDSGIGVRVGLVVRTVDVGLQTEGFAAGAQASGRQVTSDALAALDAVSGQPGGGSDLPTLLGALRDAFSGLSGDPSNATQQSFVVDQASALARGVNQFGQAASRSRQAAQDGAVGDVAAANAALKTIGQLSVQILNARSRGDTTAPLEDQRDAALTEVANITGARIFHQPNGDVLAIAGGLVLPQNVTDGPFSLAPGTVGTAGGPAAPRLFVSGLDVTGQFATQASGVLGAHLALRDVVLPGVQAQVDGFAFDVASRFQASGLTLFSDGSGTVPAAAAGFSEAIGVSAAVRVTPSEVRDGAGAAGAAGAAGLITAVLAGPLATGPGTLAGQATELVASVAGQASAASARLKTDQGVAQALSTRLASTTGVSVDAELADLVKLQAAYTANARVLASTNQVWNDLFAAVSGR